jgi:hypothetical protein
MILAFILKINNESSCDSLKKANSSKGGDAKLKDLKMQLHPW